MNTPTDIPADIHIPSAMAKSATRLENCAHQHPGSTILLAAGLGIAAVLIARALTPPPPPRSRAVHLLEDIQQRLSSLAQQGTQAVGRGVDSIDDLHLDRSFGKLSSKFKNLFH
ncbi:MAG: hypothetical protein WAW39_29360 [Prosthecobacter sp.]|uniref:hypothetical protein n=1 Tax=Prosthecobacter sp. TaxID=1965333 RepID=UPI003BAEC445